MIDVQCYTGLSSKIGKTLKIFGVTLFSALVLFDNFSAIAYAVALPDSEINALSSYSNWVADECAPTGSSTASTGATPGPIYIMGDSITNIAKPSYIKKFKDAGWVPTVEGRGSRQIQGTPPAPDGLGQIEQDKSVIANTNVIVVALGTNGVSNSAATTKAQVSKAMAKIKKYNTNNAPVYWVNVMYTLNKKDAQTTNAAIKEAAGSDANIIDWYSEAENKADLGSFEGGVHPTKPKDIDLLVNLVYKSVTASSASATTGGTGSTIKYLDKAVGNIPAAGKDVGATIYGGSKDGGVWQPHNTNQGGGDDDNGLSNQGNTPLAGHTAFAELSNPGTKDFAALGNIPNGTKLAITLKGKTIIAEKMDVGSGGGPINGKPRAIDLWWETARLLDMSDNSVVNIRPVDPSTPVTNIDGETAAPAEQVCCGSGGENVTPGTGAPDGAKFPSLAPPSMASAIDKWIEKTNKNSGMKGLGSTIVATAKHSDVSPFLIVAIARKESILADPSVFNVTQGNNAFGRTAAPGQPSFQGSRAWYKWSSIKASVDYTAPENQTNKSGDMGSFLKDVYGDSIAKDDFVAVMNKYAPPSENDTATYIAQVKSWVKELVELSNGTPTAASTSSTNPADSASSSSSSSNSVCCPPGDTSSSAGDTPNVKYIDMTKEGRGMGHGKLNKINSLVIHYTQGNTEGAALASFFIHTEDDLGIQFNIGKTGKVYQYFPLNDMQQTYHVGEINSQSIGIEITGSDGEALINNQEQFKVVVSTVKFLCDQYNIPCSDPKGDITNSSPREAQGLLGHSEAPNPNSPDARHSDPDTKINYSGGRENDINIATGKPWTDADRKNSNIHAYMKKLRGALGYNEAPGGTGGASTSGENPQDACPLSADNSGADANMKKTIKVTTPGKFITLPSKYSCPGYTTRIDSRIAADVAYIATKYNMCSHDGLANGHLSHGAGLGIDMVPRSGNSKKTWQDTVEASARAIGWYGDGAFDPKGSKKSCADYIPGDFGSCMHVTHPDKFSQWLRWLGYNGAYNHGDPWHIYGSANPHIHIGWDTPNGDGVASSIISTPRSSVYAFPAPVPDDLKNLIK